MVSQMHSLGTMGLITREKGPMYQDFFPLWMCEDLQNRQHVY